MDLDTARQDKSKLKYSIGTGTVKIKKSAYNKIVISFLFCTVVGSVLGPHSVNPGPAKNFNWDPSCFLTLPRINPKLFYNYQIFPSKEVN